MCAKPAVARPDTLHDDVASDDIVRGRECDRSSRTGGPAPNPAPGSRARIARGVRWTATLAVALTSAALAACTDGPTWSEGLPESTANLQRNPFEPTPGQLRTIAVLDDCQASDPDWAEVGGCELTGGRISLDDFAAALPQGHPSWRNDPAYAKVTLRGNAFRNISVENHGGREHSFTSVAEFGGGFLGFLNAPGQDAVPECASPLVFGNSILTPGASLRIASLQPGVHRFQCCFHPWMRTELRVD